MPATAARLIVSPRQFLALNDWLDTVRGYGWGGGFEVTIMRAWLRELNLDPDADEFKYRVTDIVVDWSRG